MRSLAGNDENERGEKKEKESLSGDFFFLLFHSSRRIACNFRSFTKVLANLLKEIPLPSKIIKFARVKYYFFEFDNFFFFFFSFSFFEYGMTFNCRTINNCFRENRKYISFPLRNRPTIRFC